MSFSGIRPLDDPEERLVRLLDRRQDDIIARLKPAEGNQSVASGTGATVSQAGAAQPSITALFDRLVGGGGGGILPNFEVVTLEPENGVLTVNLAQGGPRTFMASLTSNTAIAITGMTDGMRDDFELRLTFAQAAGDPDPVLTMPAGTATPEGLLTSPGNESLTFTTYDGGLTWLAERRFVSNLAADISAGFEVVRMGWEAFVSDPLGYIEDRLDEATGAFTSAAAWFQARWDEASSAVITTLKDVWGTLGSVAAAVTSWWNGLVASATGAWDAILKWLVEQGTSAVRWLRNIWSAIPSSVRTAAEDALAIVARFFSGNPPTGADLTTFFTRIGAGVVGWIGDVVGSISGNVGEWIKWLFTTVKSGIDVVARFFSGDLPTGQDLLDFFTRIGAGVVGWIDGLFASATGGLGGWIKWLFTSVKSGLDAVARFFSGLSLTGQDLINFANNVGRGIAEWFGNLVGQLTGAGTTIWQWIKWVFENAKAGVDILFRIFGQAADITVGELATFGARIWEGVIAGFENVNNAFWAALRGIGTVVLNIVGRMSNLTWEWVELAGRFLADPAGFISEAFPASGTSGGGAGGDTGHTSPAITSAQGTSLLTGIGRGVTEWFGRVVTTATAGIFGWLKRLTGPIQAGLEAAGAAWQGFVDDPWGTLVSWGGSILDALDIGIESAVETVESGTMAAATAAQDLLDTTRDLLGSALGVIFGTQNTMAEPSSEGSTVGRNLDLNTYDLLRVDRIFFESNQSYRTSSNRPHITSATGNATDWLWFQVPGAISFNTRTTGHILRHIGLMDQNGLNMALPLAFTANAASRGIFLLNAIGFNENDELGVRLPASQGGFKRFRDIGTGGGGGGTPTDPTTPTGPTTLPAGAFRIPVVIVSSSPTSQALSLTSASQLDSALGANLNNIGIVRPAVISASPSASGVLSQIRIYWKVVTSNNGAAWLGVDMNNVLSTTRSTTGQRSPAITYTHRVRPSFTSSNLRSFNIGALPSNLRMTGSWGIHIESDDSSGDGELWVVRSSSSYDEKRREYTLDATRPQGTQPQTQLPRAIPTISGTPSAASDLEAVFGADDGCVGYVTTQRRFYIKVDGYWFYVAFSSG